MRFRAWVLQLEGGFSVQICVFSRVCGKEKQARERFRDIVVIIFHIRDRVKFSLERNRVSLFAKYILVPLWRCFSLILVRIIISRQKLE